MQQFNGVYKTMDVAPDQQQGYHSIDEIAEIFDAIIMRDVVEHLSRDLWVNAGVVPIIRRFRPTSKGKCGFSRAFPNGVK